MWPFCSICFSCEAEKHLDEKRTSRNLRVSEIIIHECIEGLIRVVVHYCYRAIFLCLADQIFEICDELNFL